MNDETYQKIFRKVKQWSADCVPDVDFISWIRALRKASILQLDTTDTWIEDEASIQVRRMWEQDLESRLDLPESEHEYEESLDVIKLPLPIPTEKPSSAPQFLFIRPDEYALFKCVGQKDWCILTGNPGISKSWFQWKFILFCYCLDLFDKLSPFKEKLGEVLEEDAPSLKVPTTEGQASSKNVRVEHLKQVEESVKGLKIEDETFINQKRVKQKEFKEVQEVEP